MAFPRWASRVGAAIGVSLQLASSPLAAGQGHGHGHANGHAAAAGQVKRSAPAALPAPAPAPGPGHGGVLGLATPFQVAAAGPVATPVPTAAAPARGQLSGTTRTPALAAAARPVLGISSSTAQVVIELPLATPPAAAGASPPPVAPPAPGPAQVSLPAVGLPVVPESTQLAVGFFALPLMVLVWLWALIRAAAAGWRRREAAVRRQLALQLGLSPAELAAVGAAGLRRLRDQVAFDEVTGVIRRAAGVEGLEREIARALRERAPLSIAFIDADRLKAVNDSVGHEAGDALLRAIASMLTGRLRATDLVFRYGGDEFVVLLPETEASGAYVLAEKIRLGVAGLVVPGSDMRTSMSVGVVSYPDDGRTSDELMISADQAMYASKRSGKNRVMGVEMRPAGRAGQSM
jgi:diguanylate cyclase (GGDEF)-like protein